MEEDRLSRIEKLLERRKKRGSALSWITYNPSAEFNYDVEDAEEDVAWMVWEIKRLRRENREFKEFIDSLRSQMEEEFGGHPPDT
jgi:hypothetical protein